MPRTMRGGPRWLLSGLVFGMIGAAAPNAHGSEDTALERAMREALLTEVVVRLNRALDRLNAPDPGIDDFRSQSRQLNRDTLSHAERWLEFGSRAAAFNRNAANAPSPEAGLKHEALELLRAFQASAASVNTHRKRYDVSKQAAEKALAILDERKAALKALAAADHAWAKAEQEALAVHQGEVVRSQSAIEAMDQTLAEDVERHAEAIDGFNRGVGDATGDVDADRLKRQHAQLSVISRALEMRREILRERAARLEEVAAQLVSRRRAAAEEIESRRARQTLKAREIARYGKDVEAKVVAANDAAVELASASRAHLDAYGARGGEFVEALVAWLERPSRTIWYDGRQARRFSDDGQAVRRWYALYAEGQALDRRAHAARVASKNELAESKAKLLAQKEALLARADALRKAWVAQSERIWARSAALERRLAKREAESGADSARAALRRARLSLVVLSARAWIDALSGEATDTSEELQSARVSWRENAVKAAKRAKVALPDAWRSIDVLVWKASTAIPTDVPLRMTRWFETRQGVTMIQSLARGLEAVVVDDPIDTVRSALGQVLASRGVVSARPGGLLLALGGQLFELEERFD